MSETLGHVEQLSINVAQTVRDLINLEEKSSSIRDKLFARTADLKSRLNDAEKTIAKLSELNQTLENALKTRKDQLLEYQKAEQVRSMYRYWYKTIHVLLLTLVIAGVR